MAKMVKNMIMHGKMLQNQLRKLSSDIVKSKKNQSDYNNSTIDKFVVCFTEFRDDFNPYNSNNANNSVTLHQLSIVPVDSTYDSNEFTHPIAIGHKHKENLLNENFFIKGLNKMMDHENEILFYSRLLGKFINVVLQPSGFMADQPGKRGCANHAGGNSDYGAFWGCSCNIKDLHSNMSSCHECAHHFSIGKDVGSCLHCLNWNLMNGRHSEECVKENLGTAT